MCTGCDVAQAMSYSSGCVVSACITGWKVSDDESKCDANVCSCPNGVAASDGACTVDGANMCESCSAGFTLGGNETACVGMLREVMVAKLVYLRRHVEWDNNDHALAFSR